MPLSLEYIAGFFDGEGSISWSTPKKYPNKKYPRVELGNTNFQIIEEISYQFNGKFDTQWAKSKRSIGTKPFARWYCYGKNAYTFLRAICPHLRIKQQQALDALKYLERYRDN